MSGRAVYQGTAGSCVANVPGPGNHCTNVSNTPTNSACTTANDCNFVAVNSETTGNADLNTLDANIQITPQTATNAVGTNHTLTITVNALNGTIDPGLHTATASIVSGPGSFVGSPSCSYDGGAADPNGLGSFPSASCTVVITSGTPGTTVVSATSNIPVSNLSGSDTIARTTGTQANLDVGGSDNAQKV